MQDDISRLRGDLQRRILLASPFLGWCHLFEFIVEISDRKAEPVSSKAIFADFRPEGDELFVEIDVVPFDDHQSRHGFAGDRLAFTIDPILDLRLGHLSRGVVLQRYRNDFAYRFRQVGFGHLTNFFGETFENIPVTLRLPTGRDCRL